MPMASEYEDYLELEWSLFAGDPARQRESAQAVAGVATRRVLDVGCGAGQEMIPFAAAGAWCVGVDIARQSAGVATRLFAERYPGLPVTFARAAAEDLPFDDGAFDVLLCRVVIPYTDNARALGEMSRVLRPGGALLLKVHHLRYYLRKLAAGLRQGSPLSAVHALRVLVSGALYHATGRQPAGGLLLRESFLTAGLLKRELGRAGLTVERELADSNALTPSYLVLKRLAGPYRASS
jgi:SAM-dependent methyltransferase